MTGQRMALADAPKLIARWGPRAESAGDVAASLMLFLRDLARIGYVTRNILISGPDSPAGPFRSAPDIELDEFVESLHERKCAYVDRRGGPMPFGAKAFRKKGLAFGFTGLMKNAGSLDIEAVLGATEGANVMTLRFSPQPKVTARGLKKAREMMESLVFHWRPDIAAIASEAFRDDVATSRDVLAPGWITYVARTDCAGEALGLHKAERDGDAMWFQLTKTVGDDPAHERELARKLRRALLGAGALRY